MTRLNVDDARCEALFASALQRSDAPDAEVVAEAIRATVRRFGTRGCAGWMAQEFGDHPEEAAERMRWVRQLVAEHPPPGRPGRQPHAVYSKRALPGAGDDRRRMRTGAPGRPGVHTLDLTEGPSLQRVQAVEPVL
jgi:hypothetical protein